MTGEDVTLKRGQDQINTNVMIGLYCQSFARLQAFSTSAHALYRQSEGEAGRLIRSDESDLKDEIAREVVNAMLLMRKKYRLRYYLLVIKKLWPKSPYKQK